MYHKKMDCTHETSIKSKIMSTFKKREITIITANVKPGKSRKSPYLRNYKQMHSFIMTNKKENF
jgi:hypothetical protein